MCFRLPDEKKNKFIENNLPYKFYPFYFITTFNKWETGDSFEYIFFTLKISST